MDAMEVVAFVRLASKITKRKKRRWWVHPINTQRHLQGAFHVLFGQLREDEEKFFNYFRMSEPSINELLSKLQEHIKRQDTNMRCAIPPPEMLAVTLRYLGSGCSFQDLHFSYKIGRTTAGKTIKFTCQKIWDVIREECIPKPSEAMWKSVAEKFHQRANFPNCIGAVDGKHIRIVKPGGSFSLFFNYKHYFSVLLAIADADYKFIFVDIGAFGKESDSTIFKESALWKALQNKTLEVPHESHITGITTPMPYSFVGDEAFALSPHVLRPYAGSMLEVKKRVFNYRLSRARRFVECAFGILSNKWRIFHRPIDVHINFVSDIVKCCCVLHNYVRARDGYKLDDTDCKWFHRYCF